MLRKKKKRQNLDTTCIHFRCIELFSLAHGNIEVRFILRGEIVYTNGSMCNLHATLPQFDNIRSEFFRGVPFICPKRGILDGSRSFDMVLPTFVDRNTVPFQKLQMSHCHVAFANCTQNTENLRNLHMNSNEIVSDWRTIHATNLIDFLRMHFTL